MIPSIELIVVVSGEAGDDLAALAASLQRQIGSDESIHVRAVNNAASKATLEQLAQFPWIQVSDFGDNLGYGAALNRAVPGSPVQAMWIVACNADLVFPPGSIKAMRLALAAVSEKVACIAPLLLDPPQQGSGVQPSIGTFPTLAGLLTGRLRPRRTRKYRATPRGPQNVDWATGACLALRRSAFEAVGGFDDSMFLDYEETDLCKRLADAGWVTRFEPSWQVIHTSPNAQRPADPSRQVHTRRSLVRYLARHRPAWEVHAMELLLRSTLALHRPTHPFAPSWRAGLETCRLLRKQPTP